jgi:uncharacterized protein YjbK
VKEIELKYVLEGEGAYQRLCEFLAPPVAEFDQVNHYFHTADLAVPGPGGMIRVRVERGKTLFAVKLGGRLSGGVLSASEFEIELPKGDEFYRSSPQALWEAGNPGMELLERECGAKVPLLWAGRLINHRAVFRWEHGCRLEADASLFPDGYKDYEVELETASPEEHRASLVRLLESLGIPVRPQTKTKYQRFLEHCRDKAP